MIKSIQKATLGFISAFLSTKMFLVLGSVFISLIVLTILIKQITYNTDIAFDQHVFDYLSKHISDSNTTIMQAFTFFGGHKFLVPAWLLVFASFYFLKDYWALRRASIIAFSNLLLLFGLKSFFNRPRPLVPLLNHVSGLSFPSGHAYMSLIFFGLHIYFIYKHVSNKWLKWVSIICFVTMIITIGISRVYLRLHYASDVLAGYCIGIFSLIMHLWIIKRVEKYNQRKSLSI